MKGKLIKTLMPVFEVDGKQYAMLTPQLAGVSMKQVGSKVVDLDQCRDRDHCGAGPADYRDLRTALPTLRFNGRPRSGLRCFDGACIRWRRGETNCLKWRVERVVRPHRR